MQIREALKSDIPQMQIIRNAVKENTLSDPSLVTGKDYEETMSIRGKGWIYEIIGQIAGFAIADLKENNIWALFVNPDFEGRGAGRLLHDTMMDWYFAQTQQTVWLSTSPNTRAETFYRLSGWTETGKHGMNELRFEMTFEDWQNVKRNKGR